MNPIDMMVTDFNCEYLGLSRLCLMESAGKSLAFEISKIAVYNFSKPVKIIIFTGSGGNGGDGFVAARYLLNRGYDVEICMLKDNIKSPQAKANLEILKNMKPRLSHLSIHTLETLDEIEDDSIIVDGILGTGIKGKLQKDIKSAVELINSSNALKISVDVPSGMNPLTGEVTDIAVKPDYTVSFHKIKTCVRNSPEEEVGGMVVCDIGIPLEAEYFISYGDFLRLKKRQSNSHKGKNGKVLIVGGSKDYNGAVTLSGLAAINSGCDLVYVAAPESAAGFVKSASPDLIVKSLGGDYLSLNHLDDILEIASKVDAVLIGPGSSVNDETSKLFNILVSKIKKPIVLDADALKQVDISLIKNREDVVLTPHIFEFKKFFNVSDDLKLDLDSDDYRYVLDNISEFQSLTSNIKASVILKGQFDLILKKNKFRINKSGNPGMTVGGTGDVLAGLVTSLIAQNLSPFDAACLASFINGLAGEEAYKQSGYAFSASEIISYIGSVIKNGLC